MLNFKPIEDFTFDDCVRSLDRHRSEGTSPDEELLSRYNLLLETLKAEEKRDYPSVKTIDRLERYIKKYSNLATATKYNPAFLAKAKQELADLRKQAKIKKRIKIVACILLVLGVFAGIFFIGYKPISYFYVSDSSVTISKGAGSDTINLRTNAPDIYIDEYISWLDVSKDGSYIIIKADRNTEDLRNGDFSIRAYPTFFGERIGFMEKSLTIHVEQQDGYASFLNINKDEIEIWPEGDEESIYVETDGNEWNVDSPSEGWLTVSKSGSRVNIKVYENTTKSSRTASFRIYSDSQEKYVSVTQDVYAKDAGISEISMNDGTGYIDMKIRVDYYTQGYLDEDMYVCIKIYSDKNNNVWYRNYEKIYPTQPQSESYRTFTVRSSVWHGKYGDNTIYACISRYTDGSSPICSFEQGFNVRSNR